MTYIGSATSSIPYSSAIAPPSGSYGGGCLSDVQLAQVFYEAGFRGENLVYMVAIAKRESGGDPRACNDNAGTRDLSYGLVQINMIGSLGVARREQLGLSSNEQLLDPLTNARAAFVISGNGTDLGPWGGYKGVSNTFNTDIPAARAAVEQAQAQGLLGQPLDGGSGPAPAADAATAAAAANDPAPAAAAQPVLRIGARGEAVKDLQRQLIAAGFDPGPVDGWFGPRTQAAVRAFQHSRGITVDGWVGPQTWGKLGTTGAANGGRLAQGSSGAQVKELQQLLQSLGYYRANVGGNFGPQTDAAVRAFQRDRGLTVDGWAGPQTMAALRQAAQGGGTPAAPAAPADPAAPDGLPPPGTRATTPAPGVVPVTSGGREPRTQAAVAYGTYWANQPAGTTAYVGGASEYRFGGVGDGSTAKASNQKRYLAPRGVVGFDCSGLVVAMYAQAGVDLRAHGMTYTGAMLGLPQIAPSQLQPGDLIVKSGHVVVYIGNGQVVEATPYGPNPGDGSAPVGGVRISDASKFLNDPAYSCHRVPDSWFS